VTYDPRQVTETPFGAPLVPRFPLRMRDTEILTVVYRTDAEAADRLLPAPLELLGDLVLVHLYRMHDAEVFGRYGESAVHLPARHPASGTEGAYSPFLFVESDGAIAAGREIYGQPKKHGVIELRLKDGTLVGRLSRDGAPVLTVTTAYRETRGAPEDLERHASFRTNINLKVVPAVDGSGAAIRQLTAREFAEVTIREVWKSPAAVEIVPNDEAPLHLLPVRDVLEAFHWRADFTLVYGRVLEDLT
jgi:acetoacetate decarboxylase